MPKDGERRYLTSVEGWVKQPPCPPRYVLAEAYWTSNQEKPHESHWIVIKKYHDIQAIEMAMKHYGHEPSE